MIDAQTELAIRNTMVIGGGLVAMFRWLRRRYRKPPQD